MKHCKKYWTRTFLLLSLILFNMLFFNNTAKARELNSIQPSIVDSINVSLDGKYGDRQQYLFTIKFSEKENGQIKPGDTLTIDLPEGKGFDFSNVSNMEKTSPDGMSIIKVDRDCKQAVITFTDKVADKGNISGSAFFTAHLATTPGYKGENNTGNIESNFGIPNLPTVTIPVVDTPMDIDKKYEGHKDNILDTQNWTIQGTFDYLGVGENTTTVEDHLDLSCIGLDDTYQDTENMIISLLAYDPFNGYMDYLETSFTVKQFEELGYGKVAFDPNTKYNVHPGFKIIFNMNKVQQLIFSNDFINDNDARPAYRINFTTRHSDYPTDGHSHKVGEEFTVLNTATVNDNFNMSQSSDTANGQSKYIQHMGTDTDGNENSDTVESSSESTNSTTSSTEEGTVPEESTTSTIENSSESTDSTTSSTEEGTVPKNSNSDRPDVANSTSVSDEVTSSSITDTTETTTSDRQNIANKKTIIGDNLYSIPTTTTRTSSNSHKEGMLPQTGTKRAIGLIAVGVILIIGIVIYIIVRRRL